MKKQREDITLEKVKGVGQGQIMYVLWDAKIWWDVL